MRNGEVWREPARDLSVLARPDVLVLGGGSAGVAAAVAAGRRGADTWLVERSGFVGGLATVGLINLLLTMDDGAGTQVVAGLCQEVVDRLAARGRAAFPPPGEWDSEDPALVARWKEAGLVWGAPESVRYSVAFDPEDFVDVCYELLEGAGVRLRLHTGFAATHTEGGRVRAVVVESKRGREVLIPEVVVDATGDADVAVSCGAECELVPIPPHLWFRVGGVAADAELGPLAFRTLDAGRLLVPWGPGPDRVDATDPDDMTRAEVACRRAARATFDALRRDTPGWSEAWLDDYARMLGITESRRLVGDHVLAKEDAGTPLPDAVARTGHWTRRRVWFDIPYRSLKTAAVDNLLVTGRCISTTRYVHQATKEIPAAMATGEAAGSAAALAARAGVGVHAVDVAELRRDLAAAGALVGGV
ncbi:MAG TPA: FAD-dependent oxidoreductase [Acidimicrobiales bacterium]|nr:FAD-dependent oxidoreductase [Acidimicrobiales bacterium]